MKRRRYKRWITLLGGLNDVLRLALKHGVGVYYAGKPGMVAWYGLGFEATPAEMRSFTEACEQTPSRLLKRQPAGAWPVPVYGEVMTEAHIRAYLERKS